MGAEFGGERIRVFIRLSPFPVHLKLLLSRHCSLPTPQYESKVFVFFFKKDTVGEGGLS